MRTERRNRGETQWVLTLPELRQSMIVRVCGVPEVSPRGLGMVLRSPTYAPLRSSPQGRRRDSSPGSRRRTVWRSTRRRAGPRGSMAVLPLMVFAS